MTTDISAVLLLIKTGTPEPKLQNMTSLVCQKSIFNIIVNINININITFNIIAAQNFNTHTHTAELHIFMLLTWQYVMSVYAFRFWAVQMFIMFRHILCYYIFITFVAKMNAWTGCATFCTLNLDSHRMEIM